MLSPQEKKEIEELKRKVQVLENFMTQKKIQQITYPLDEASKTIISNL